MGGTGLYGGGQGSNGVESPPIPPYLITLGTIQGTKLEIILALLPGTIRRTIQITKQGTTRGTTQDIWDTLWGTIQGTI